MIQPGKKTNSLVEIRDLVEKPSKSSAPSNLAIIGRYILEPKVFEDLGRLELGAKGEIQVTDAIALQIGSQPVNGFLFKGQRFDCGSKVGFLEANIAFALDRPELKEPVSKFIKKFC